MSQMSAAGALRAPRAHVQSRPELRVVHGATAVAAPPRLLPFVLFCAGLLAAGLLALLFINMSLAQGAYQLRDLTVRSSMLGENEQELREELARLESPQHLSEAARSIGMVPGTDPAFLDVQEGQVIGEATPAPEATKQATGAQPGSTKRP